FPKNLQIAFYHKHSCNVHSFFVIPLVKFVTIKVGQFLFFMHPEQLRPGHKKRLRVRLPACKITRVKYIVRHWMEQSPVGRDCSHESAAPRAFPEGRRGCRSGTKRRET
ncbi:MAG: hypothetical protein J5949_04730, partial [Oscillospiraceae bacterium]|nr:hypothetical protein [Oscillospiraceae bacterium]